jgi:hypothetical protein
MCKLHMYYTHNKQVIVLFSICGSINYMFWSNHVSQLYMHYCPNHFPGRLRLHCIWYLPHFQQTKWQVVYYNVSLHSSDETLLQRYFSLHFLPCQTPYKYLKHLLTILHHVFNRHIVGCTKQKLTCVPFSCYF